jgi:phosphatidylserine/phosphatidylglycerophosphate/cardiolipin synthase-like enzyme
MDTRKIFKSATMAQHSVRDALAIVLAQELIAPSRDLFIVAPWISNIQLFDNSEGRFQSLNPEWIKGEIRLHDILVSLAGLGSRVRVYTRPDAHNNVFLERLEAGFSQVGASTECVVARRQHLHTKGLLTNSVLIDGSMNLTHNGIALNDEQVTVSFDPVQVAQARVHFETYAN